MSRIQLIEQLEKLAATVCGYSRDGRLSRVCDCKLGAEKFGGRGEKTGCAELRSMIGLLSRLSDEEYLEIVARKPNE